jgi:hypothetical protein
LSLSVTPRLGLMPCQRLEAQMPPDKKNPGQKTSVCRRSFSAEVQAIPPQTVINKEKPCLIWQDGRAPSNQFAQILTPIGPTAIALHLPISPRWHFM